VADVDGGSSDKIKNQDHGFHQSLNNVVKDILSEAGTIGLFFFFLLFFSSVYVTSSFCTLLRLGCVRR
jgi:hypothetical protein